MANYLFINYYGDMSIESYLNYFGSKNIINNSKSYHETLFLINNAHILPSDTIETVNDRTIHVESSLHHYLNRVKISHYYYSNILLNNIEQFVSNDLLSYSQEYLFKHYLIGQNQLI
ncbi:hypothetical protein BLOT_012143 [Blomia tropicalis]|nr:hypothetical protein BLOT_012143 [Blomia tropicalis]